MMHVDVSIHCLARPAPLDNTIANYFSIDTSKSIALFPQSFFQRHISIC